MTLLTDRYAAQIAGYSSTRVTRQPLMSTSWYRGRPSIMQGSMRS